MRWYLQRELSMLLTLQSIKFIDHYKASALDSSPKGEHSLSHMRPLGGTLGGILKRLEKR